MKYFIGFICTFALYNASIRAQELSWEQRKNLKDSVYQLLQDYQLSVSFRALDRDGISERKIEKFRSLFETNARLVNDIYPVYNQKAYQPDYPYRFAEVGIEEYMDTIRRVFPNGLRVNFHNANLDYGDFNAGRVRIFLIKEVFGETWNSLQFQNLDTLVLVLHIRPQVGIIKIARIDTLNSNFECANCDFDEDGIINEKDPFPYEQPPTGYPQIAKNIDNDIHNSKFPDSKLFLSFFVEGMRNRPEMAALQSSSFGYDSLLRDSLKYDLSPGKNLKMLLTLDYFLWRNLAISTGIEYNMVTYGITGGTFHAEYKAIDIVEGDTISTYRQLLTANQLEEQIKAHYLTIPLFLEYQKNISEKLGYFIHLGPSFSILMNGTSRANTIMDYEAVYAYTVSDNLFSFSEQDHDSDWRITREQAESSTPENPDAVMSYFEERRNAGYNVALDTLLNNTTTFNQKIGISGHFKAGIILSIKDNVSLLIGGSVALGKTLNQKQANYKLTDRVGEYKTLLAASDHVQILSYGVNLGLTIGIGKSKGRKVND